MADLQSAFRTRLKAVAGLNTPTGGRIEWGGVKQGTPLPYIILSKAGAGQSWTHSGPDELVGPLVSADIYGSSNAEASALAGALQSEMQRLDVVTVAGWDFLPPGMLDNDQWLGPEDIDGGRTAHRIIQDYRFYAQPA